MKKFILLIILSFCSSIAAGEKSKFLYLQQEEPGEIIYVSVIPRPSDAVVSVVGMGKMTGEKRDLIPLNVYNQYVTMLTSQDSTKYEFIPKGDESVTGLDVYTVRFELNGVEKMLKFPHNGLEGQAVEFVGEMHKYISKAALTRR